jgi:hypothetical protein
MLRKDEGQGKLLKLHSFKTLYSIMVLILVFVFVLNTNTYAQDIESASSLNPVGSGARATGMGGAFIGVAGSGNG